jgi:hypothetical protein
MEHGRPRRGCWPLGDSPLLTVEPGWSWQGDVAALLRRVAESLDALRDVDVQDVVFHSEVTEGEDDLTMTTPNLAGDRSLVVGWC